MEVDEPANEEEEEPKAMETEEVKEKPREIMYQDDEGFFGMLIVLFWDFYYFLIIQFKF